MPKGEPSGELDKMIGESVQEAGPERLNPQEFAADKEAQKAKRAAELKAFRERADVQAAARSVSEGAKTVIDLLKTGPELMDSGLNAAVDAIQDATGHSEGESKRILKNVLIESLKTIQDESLADRVILAIERLAEGASSKPADDNEEQAA